MKQQIDVSQVRLTGQISDRLGDMLARIRNAQMAMHDEVAVPSTRLLVDVARLMTREGYLEGYRVEQGPVGDVLVIRVKYRQDRTPVITGMRRESKPGRRVYSRSSELPRVMGGLGVALVTTSKGVMTTKEAAGHGVGGEVLCSIW